MVTDKRDKPPPTAITLLVERTATRESFRAVGMLLMRSHELVDLLYLWMADEDLNSSSYPPTASSSPLTAAQVEQ